MSWQGLIVLLSLSFTFYINNVTSLHIESIVGGHEAPDNFLKYHVAIVAKFEPNQKRRPVCSATIIGEDSLLTVAHCFINDSGALRMRWYEVIAGANDPLDKRGILIQVNTIYVPEYYNSTSFANDIAVLKVDGQFFIGYDSRVSHLELPKFGTSCEGVAIFSGYGSANINITNANGVRNRYGNSYSLMKYSHVLVLGRKECDRQTGKQITDHQLCGKTITSHVEQQWGACLGDGGGPLVMDNKIVGLLSRVRYDCVDFEIPAIYTKVSSYVRFIQNILNNNILNKTQVFKNPLPHTLKVY